MKITLCTAKMATLQFNNARRTPILTTLLFFQTIILIRITRVALIRIILPSA